MADNNPNNQSGTSNLNKLFQTAGSQNQQQGTGYTNLNRLFNANQNNQLGTKVAGNVQNQIGNVQGQLKNQQEQFNTEAEKNRVDTEENKANRNAVIGRFSDSSGSQKTEAPSEQDVTNFQKYQSGNYQGPSGLQDVASLQNTANQLKQQTSNFSPSSTQELLRRTVGPGNNYTQGQQRLDTILLDRSGLRPVQRQAAALGGQVATAGTNAANIASQYGSGAQNFANETKNQLQGALTGLDTAAQQQFAGAQSAENDRLAKLQAIQNFAANKSPVLDANGQPVKDQYGNTQYTEGARGTTDQYGQIDALQNLLKSQGLQDSEISQIFGGGNAATGNQTRLTNLEKINALMKNEAAAGQIGAGQLGFNNQDLAAKYAENTGQLQQDILAGKLSQEDLQNIYNTNQNTSTGEDVKTNLFDLANQGYTQRLPYHQDEFNDINQQYYGGLGIAGQALQGGKTENLYSNLAKIAGNSQAAQNLTKEGVASQPLRSNYAALSRLMGSTADPYATGGGYQAGNILLNPELLKKSL